MAAGAWRQLRRTRIHAVNRAARYGTMALVAQSVDVRHIQQPRILRSMGRVAAHAAFGLDRGMFVDKRPARLGVALGAYRVLVCCGLQVVVPERPVNIVAIAALHQLFIHLVVEGHVERGLHVRVALEAKCWLRSLEQRLFLAAVNFVAAEAADIGLRMR